MKIIQATATRDIEFTDETTGSLVIIRRGDEISVVKPKRERQATDTNGKPIRQTTDNFIGVHEEILFDIADDEFKTVD